MKVLNEKENEGLEGLMGEVVTDGLVSIVYP